MGCGDDEADGGSKSEAMLIAVATLLCCFAEFEVWGYLPD